LLLTVRVQVASQAGSLDQAAWRAGKSTLSLCNDGRGPEPEKSR